MKIRCRLDKRGGKPCPFAVFRRPQEFAFERLSFVRAKSPHYAALTQPVPLGLADIQRLLDPDTLLLEYSLGPTNSYLWVVSQNSLKSFRLAKSPEIEAKAKELYTLVSKPGSDAEARRVAAELGQIVLAPAAAELGKKRLAIVADGALSYIPFSVLAADTSRGPLVADHEIIYLPSASTLAALREESAARKQPEKTLAVLADPVFDPSDTRVIKGNSPSPASNTSTGRAAADSGFGISLPRLPGTREEAAAILSVVPQGERIRAVDFEASKATILKPEIANYRIVHLATHGLLNSQHPELSGLALSMVDEKGGPLDGFLRLNEIYNMRLTADLVVLSACQTALGKEVKGEGLIGLTRGFLYAGARRVAASQWVVDDESTSELMRLFYQGMLGDKKLPAAAALREAQLTLLAQKRFSALYYWSPFVIQGDWK